MVKKLNKSQLKKLTGGNRNFKSSSLQHSTKIKSDGGAIDTRNHNVVIINSSK